MAAMRADSLAELDEVRRLSAMIHVRTKELRNEELRQKLDGSRFQVLVLVLILTASLIIAILSYRAFQDNRERNKVIVEVANTRGKMISILSHDIRTPLSQLQSMLDQHDAEAFSAEELQMILDQIRETNGNTLNLLDKTVSWINLNRTNFKVNKTEFALGDLFTELESLVKGKLEEKGLILVQEIEHEFLNTDRFLVQTALFNLLSNAIKFSPSGSKVFLRSYWQDGAPVLEVEDQGRGMEKQKLDELMDEISSTSIGTDQEIGSGLGLVIVRDAIKRINGQLQIESQLGKGTISRIVL